MSDRLFILSGISSYVKIMLESDNIKSSVSFTSPCQTTSNSRASNSAASDCNNNGKAMNKAGNMSKGIITNAINVRQSLTNSTISFLAIVDTNRHELFILSHLLKFRSSPSEENSPPFGQLTFFTYIFRSWSGFI